MRADLRWSDDGSLPGPTRAALLGPGAPWEMVDEPVLGTTMRVFARRPTSVRQLLEGAAARLGDQPYLVFPDRTFTHAGIQQPVAAVAACLVDRFGVGPGDRVAIASANIAGHALTAWAAASIGAIVVELNGWWTGQELVHGIELTRPAVVFGDRRRLDRLSPGSVDAPLVCFEDDLPSLERFGEGRTLPPDPVDEDAPLAVLFTSGTTGRPKGAVLSHRAHLHGLMQASLQGQVAAVMAAGAGGAPPPAGAPCTIAVSPMFHVSGFSWALIAGPFIGATYVYPPTGRWDPEVHLELTERNRATAWSIVPTQLWRLLDHPRLGEFDLSSLRRVGGGGSTFAPELWRRVSELLPQVSNMSTGYGMTETCGSGTFQGGRSAAEHPDAVGAPVPGYEISVRGPDGEPVDPGSTGEIHLRGASNFLGYWEDDAATKDCLDEDRWYRTGELGHVEEGLLYLDGRGSDVIIRGGENIYAIQIENRLVEHPAIAEAAVVGVPDRVLGEQVKAFVVSQPGTDLGPDEVRRWVGETLAGFKVPSDVEFRDVLPHNAAGKVMKTMLGRPDGQPFPVEED